MRLFGWLLAAAVALAVLQAAVAALVAGVILLLVVGLWTNPQAVVGFIVLCVVAGLIQSQPLAFLGVVALMTSTRLLRGT